jgi:hypothetical protein
MGPKYVLLWKKGECSRTNNVPFVKCEVSLPQNRNASIVWSSLKKNFFRLINRLVFNYEYSNAHRTCPIECVDDVVIAAGILAIHHDYKLRVVKWCHLARWSIELSKRLLSSFLRGLLDHICSSTITVDRKMLHKTINYKVVYSHLFYHLSVAKIHYISTIVHFRLTNA